MPLALLILAYMLVVTGIKGNYAQVGAQFEQDVMGGGKGGGFLVFAEGIIGIAVLFRLIGMPNAGRVFLILVLLAFILENANIINTLQNINVTIAGAGTPAQPASGNATTGSVAQTPAGTPTTTTGAASAPKGP